MRKFFRQVALLGILFSFVGCTGDITAPTLSPLRDCVNNWCNGLKFEKLGVDSILVPINGKAVGTQVTLLIDTSVYHGPGGFLDGRPDRAESVVICTMQPGRIHADVFVTAEAGVPAGKEYLKIFFTADTTVAIQIKVTLVKQ